MEKRMHMRRQVRVDVTFYCAARTYSGTISDISENGMYIRMKELCVPIELQLEIHIPFREKDLCVTAYLNRMFFSPGPYSGIGVEIMKPSHEYLDFLNGLGTELCNIE